MAFDAITYALAKKYADKTVKETVSSVYIYKGSVDKISDLPTSASIGDIYNVLDEGGNNYAWTGTEWDSLGVNQSASEDKLGLISLKNNTFSNTVLKDDTVIKTGKEEFSLPKMLSGIQQTFTDYSKGAEKLKYIKTFKNWNLYNVNNIMDYTYYFRGRNTQSENTIIFSDYDKLVIKNWAGDGYYINIQLFDRDGNYLSSSRLQDLKQKEFSSKDYAGIRFRTTMSYADEDEVKMTLNYSLEKKKENGVFSTLLPAIIGGSNYSSQIKYSPLTLTKDKWYLASVTVKSEIARKFQLLVQSDGDNGGNWSVLNDEQIFDVKANQEKTFTTLFQAKEIYGQYLFGLMCGHIDGDAESLPAENIEVKNFSLKEFDEYPSFEVTNIKEYIGASYLAGDNITFNQTSDGRVEINATDFDIIKEEGDQRTDYNSYSLVRYQDGTFLGKYDTEYDYHKDDEFYTNVDYAETITSSDFLGELNLINKLNLKQTADSQAESFCSSTPIPGNPNAYGKFEAFNLSLDGQWRTQNPTSNLEYLGINLKSKQNISAVAVKWLDKSDTCPKTIEVQASSNGSDWSSIQKYDVVVKDASLVYTYSLDTPIQAQWIRVVVSKEEGNATEMVIQELGIMSANIDYYKVLEDYEARYEDTIESLVEEGIIEKISKEKMPEKATISFQLEDRFGKSLALSDIQKLTQSIEKIQNEGIMSIGLYVDENGYICQR